MKRRTSIKKFSPQFPSFSGWLSSQNPNTSSYVKRIIRLHAIHPNASLNQLAGRSRYQDEKTTKLYKLPYPVLTAREKYFRDISLEVLSEARRSRKSLMSVSNAHNISAEMVRNNTHAFRKQNGRWVAKKYDKISRVMKINENGEESSIEIADSRVASVIGRYHGTVGQYLNTGNAEALRPFKNKRIKDAKGHYHILETDPKILKEIAEHIEEPEFYEVYSS